MGTKQPKDSQFNKKVKPSKGDTPETLAATAKRQALTVKLASSTPPSPPDEDED